MNQSQMFRYKPKLPVSYNRQGYIYFISKMYGSLPKRRQQKIRELCKKHGGQYEDALLEYMTTDASPTAVCMRHHLDRSTLDRAAHRYYMGFPKKL